MRAKNYLLFLLLGTLLLPFHSSAQEKNDPVFALDIRLSSGGKKVHDYKICLAHKEKADDTVTIKKGKEVYVTLQRNEVYTFTFHKEGYRDRAMIVNTSLPDNAKAEEIFTLAFTIEMTAEDSITKKNAEIVPTAFVKYDSKADDFSLCESHHQ
jgi:Fe-S cluster assembly iron-binding protein IscA